MILDTGIVPLEILERQTDAFIGRARVRGFSPNGVTLRFVGQPKRVAKLGMPAAPAPQPACVLEWLTPGGTRLSRLCVQTSFEVAQALAIRHLCERHRTKLLCATKCARRRRRTSQPNDQNSSTE